MGESKRRLDARDIEDERQAKEALKILNESLPTTPTKLPNPEIGTVITFTVGASWVFGRLHPNAEDDFLQNFVMVEHPLMLMQFRDDVTGRIELAPAPFSRQFGDIPSNGIVAFRRVSMGVVLPATFPLTVAWCQFMKHMRDEANQSSLIVPANKGLILP